MLKKIFIVGALAVLTGCATHQQANTAVGAGAGAVLGGAMAGRGGALVGGVIGSMIGSQHPVQAQPVQRVYIEQQVIVPDRRAQCQNYNERIYKCGQLYDPIKRNSCWNYETNNYNRCLHQ